MSIPFLAFLVACGPPGASPAAKPGPSPVVRPLEARLAGFSLGLAYSGYRSGQHPDRGDGGAYPTRDQIREDLDLLTRDGNFGLIRLYDAGPHSADVLEVIAEGGLPVKVMLGAWLEGEVSNHEGCEWVIEPVPPEVLSAQAARNRAEVTRVVALARAHSQVVVAVNVGNEALVTWNDHLVPIGTMAGYLRQVKEAVDVPVTTADNYAAWVEHADALGPVVDLALVHTYPAWEGRDVDQAMPYTLENLAAVRAALPGVPLAIGEAGWATVASEFGERASEESQARYYRELTAWAAQTNTTTFWFEAFDEDWKGNPDDPLGAEKHWGLFTVDRKPKRVVRELYPGLAR